jgi:hypothetical protein
MKTHTLTLALLITLFAGACKKDNSAAGTTLTGKWKVTGHFISAGGPMYYMPEPAKADYDYVQFNTNGTVEGAVFKDYLSYKLKDSITITFTKADNITYQNYRYKIQGDSLTMSPAGPIMCIEGCSIIFHKVR